MGQTAAETAQKHEQILDQGIKLFREHGFAGVSVGEVMKAAGLTHGPFYNHFASKEALMSECLTRDMQRDTSSYDRYPSTEKGLEKYVGEYLSTQHRDAPVSGCNVELLLPKFVNMRNFSSPSRSSSKGSFRSWRLTSPGDLVDLHAARPFICTLRWWVP